VPLFKDGYSGLKMSLLWATLVV